MVSKKVEFCVGAGLAITLLAGCGANSSFSTSSVSNTNSSQGVASAPSPAGDIPDTQTFVNYTSPNGYQLQIPEGWARSTSNNEASFVSSYDGVKISVSSTSTVPTLKSVQQNEVAQLKSSSQGIKVLSVKSVSLANQSAFLINYESNSVANSVTGKQIRLEDNQYIFFKNGKEVKLSLWAPYGADNKDQWDKMANSFTWK